MGAARPTPDEMDTLWLLIARHKASPVVPVEEVCRVHFPAYDLPTLLRKINAGDIPLPLVRLDPTSQKGPKGVPLNDLARYLDARMEAARREARQLAL